MKALLVGSSPICLGGQALAILAQECSPIIGVDGGTDALLDAGVAVDLVIGDMDSLSPVAAADIDSGHLQSVRHPRDKDESDLEIALRWCLDNAIDEVACVGVTGGRLDHTLAALGSLGRSGSLCPVIHDPTSTTWLLKCDGRRTVEIPAAGTTVSVIALDEDTRLVASGLKWTLPVSLERLWDRGLSNVTTAAAARVTITRGTALVIAQLDSA